MISFFARDSVFRVQFEKMKDPDTLMDAKLNSKAHLQYVFNFLSRFVHVWFQSLQKC
jgi:hypothetical protein